MLCVVAQLTYVCIVCKNVYYIVYSYSNWKNIKTFVINKYIFDTVLFAFRQSSVRQCFPFFLR